MYICLGDPPGSRSPGRRTNIKSFKNIKNTIRKIKNWLPLIKNYLPLIKDSKNPACQRELILVKGKIILDFPKCFLNILEILDFGATARRARPSLKYLILRRRPGERSATKGVLQTTMILRIFEQGKPIID